MRHSRNAKKFEAMTDAQRLEYMATANQVTVGTIHQVFDNDLKRFYVAKVRGIIVSDGDTYRFDTVSEARNFGHSLIDHWRKEYNAVIDKAGRDCESEIAKAEGGEA